MRIVRNALLAASLVCGLSWAAVAQNYKTCFERDEKRDYPAAFRKWLPLAKKGEIAAEFCVGVLYMNGGENFPQDSLKSMYWFEKAAAQGHPIAMTNLAFAYTKGDDVPQDFVEAYILYSLATLMPSVSKSLRQSWRDEAAQRLSPKMIRDAQREVKKRWKQIRARKK